MSRNVVCYPHAVEQGLRLQIDEVFDVAQPGLKLKVVKKPVAGEDSFAVSVAESDDWRELRFHVRLTVDPSVLEEVAPDSVNRVDGLRVVVSVRCASTKVRETAPMTHQGGLTWTGEIAVRRASVRNTVELVPLIARAEPRHPPVSGFATHANDLLATGPAVEVSIDDSWSPTNSPIDIFREDFRASIHPWRRDHADDVFHLDLGGNKPQLFVNLSYKQLDAVLDSRDKLGANAAVRDLLSAWIVHACWTQLFMAAVTSIRMDVESGSCEAPEGWKAVVLREFLQTMQASESDPAARLALVARMMREPGQADQLASTVSSAVHKMIGARTLISGALRAAETSDESDI